MVFRILLLDGRWNQVVFWLVVYNSVSVNLFATRSCGGVFQVGLHKCRHLIHIEINIRNFIGPDVFDPIQTLLDAV